ncbi:MAG TPA: hypothetical protein PKB06_12930, partial [Actinotalea sp.]|nr:hypothetical protein [Actinotalea sp.]
MPLPSRRRDVLLVVGAVAAVMVAGWLGTLAGLWVQPRTASIDLEPDGRIAYVATMAIPNGPGITVHDVRAPEGTALEGFWVLGDDDPDPAAEAVDLRDLVDSLAADPSRPATLPQPAGSGTLRFAMLLSVDDCSKLTEDGVAGTPGENGALVSYPPALTLR